MGDVLQVRDGYRLQQWTQFIQQCKSRGLTNKAFCAQNGISDFMPAVELSYIKPENQRLIAVSIDGEQSSPSHTQAKRLRELDQEGKLNGDVIDGSAEPEQFQILYLLELTGRECIETVWGVGYRFKG